MSPWEWDESIHGWRNFDTGEAWTVDNMLARIEGLEAAVFSGASAVRVGLADGVADWPEFLGTLRAGFGASVDINGGGAAGAP